MIRKITRKGAKIIYEARIKRNGRTLYRNFASKKEAACWVTESRYRRDNDLPLIEPVIVEKRPSPNDIVTMKMMFDKYMEFAQNKGRAGSTLEQYRDHFKNPLFPFYKGVNMKSVSIEEHETFMQRLRKKGLGPATCNRIRSLMSVIYSTAIKKRYFEGIFKENPFTFIEKMEEDKKKIAFWDYNSMSRFLEANKDDYYYPLWLFLLNTGLRIGEACALHRDQIDFASSIVSIDRTWSDHEYKIVHRTKGKKIRHVGLNNDALYALSLVSMNNGHVFVNPDGTPILPDHVRKKLLPSACNKADVINITPHGFRHTYAANYMMGGGNIWDLSKVLGHSSVKLTEDYYAHFSKEHVLKRARIITHEGNVISANFGVRGG